MSGCGPMGHYDGCHCDAVARARREERAAIVAYLEKFYPLLGAPDLIQRIERGEHEK